MEKSKVIYQVFNAGGGWLGNFGTLKKAQAVVDQVSGSQIIVTDAAALTAKNAK